MYDILNIFVFVPGIVKYCCRLLFKFIFDLCVICSSLLLPVYTILSSMFPHVFLGLCSTYFPKTLVREELSILGGQQDASARCKKMQVQGSGARVATVTSIHVCIAMFNHSSNNYQHQRRSPVVCL